MLSNSDPKNEDLTDKFFDNLYANTILILFMQKEILIEIHLVGALSMS